MRVWTRFMVFPGLDRSLMCL